MIFKKILKIKSFGKEIYNNDLSLDLAFDQQLILRDNTDIF